VNGRYQGTLAKVGGCLGLSDICPSRETMSRATPI